MKRIDKLQHYMDWLREHDHLIPEDSYIRISGSCLTIDLYQDDMTAKQARDLKRKFGPFEVKGEAPYQRLEVCAWIEVEGEEPVRIDFHWSGAFSCEVQGYREEEVEVPEVKAQPAKTEIRKKAIFRCGPAPFKKESK